MTSDPECGLCDHRVCRCTDEDKKKSALHVAFIAREMSTGKTVDEAIAAWTASLSH